MMAECARVLRPNGAMVLFSQDPLTTALVVGAAPSLPFAYRMTWLKPHFANPLSAKKCPVNYTEDVCVFFKRAPKHDFHMAHPLRPYAAALMAHVGLSKKRIFEDMGSQALCHFMRHGSPQFSLCTRAGYDSLIALYGVDTWHGFRPFDSLAFEDAAYREALSAAMIGEHPRVFNLPDGVKTKSNVLSFARDKGAFHPTQKPVALLADILRTFSLPGAVVLDFTMGSGSTGVACADEGRTFIGIERDAKYFEIARERCGVS